MFSAISWSSAAETMSIVTKVRSGESNSSTRIVLDLTKPVKFNQYLSDKGNSVKIKFSSLSFKVPLSQKVSKGLIKNYSFQKLNSSTSILTLNSDSSIIISKAELWPPNGYDFYRFVIDIKENRNITSKKPKILFDNKILNLKSKKLAYESKKVFKNLPLSKPKLSDKKIIVIDPGHGGIDPGAIGITGTLEKDITLSTAKILKKKYEESGRYKVILTRYDDSFIKLNNRVQIAEKAKADLFISLHADSIKDKRIRGGSVYTLSAKASDKRAAALARRENRADLIGVKSKLNNEDDDVAAILISLIQRETMNQSLIYSSQLIPQLRKVGSMLRGGRREAGFAVLKSPDIPSVLVEIGFLSNKSDEKKLKKKSFQTKLSEAIVKATDSYYFLLN